MRTKQSFGYAALPPQELRVTAFLVWEEEDLLTNYRSALDQCPKGAPGWERPWVVSVKANRLRYTLLPLPSIAAQRLGRLCEKAERGITESHTLRPFHLNPLEEREESDEEVDSDLP